MGDKQDVTDAVKQQLQEALRGNQDAQVTAVSGHADSRPRPPLIGDWESPRVKCRDGKKDRFPTEEAAKAWLAKIDQMPGDPDRPYRPTRTHYCRKCKGWHLTSNHTSKRWNSVKKRN